MEPPYIVYSGLEIVPCASAGVVASVAAEASPINAAHDSAVATGAELTGVGCTLTSTSISCFSMFVTHRGKCQSSIGMFANSVALKCIHPVVGDGTSARKWHPFLAAPVVKYIFSGAEQGLLGSSAGVKVLH